MKFRPDLVAKLTPEMLMESVVANTHRYKPEPNFSKTGAGSLLTASTKERAKEDELSTAIIQKVIRRPRTSGKKRGRRN
jgi:hypothetical protein